MSVSFFGKVRSFVSKEQWFFLSLLSTILLIASFYPFHIWPLGFIALVPLIYLIETKSTEKTFKIFGAGFLLGFLFPLTLMYATVMEFTWLPEAHFFQTVIRWTSLPIAFIIGLLYGSVVVFYIKKLKTISPAKNIFILAIMCTLIEWVITYGTGGYNLGVLAHTVKTIPFFTSLAAIGGVHFVSFIVILINSFIAFLIILIQTSFKTLSSRRYFSILFGTAGGIILLFYVNTYYLRHNRTSDSITVAILQNNNRKEGAFGGFTKDTFSFPKLDSLIQKAKNAQDKPSIIIYPFAVAKEILTTSTSSLPYVATAPVQEFREWTTHLGSTTTLVTWNTIERDGKFFNEIDYWKEGEIVAKYQKTNLFPFMDYTPLWAQHIGLYSTVIDETSGADRQSLYTADNTSRIASAVCSEINATQTIQRNSRDANILFSIGSDAMFSDSFAAESDLANAQFRAAENNVAIVRANRFGPSGFIAPDGRLIEKTHYNEDGPTVLKFSYEENPRETLYSLMGNNLLIFGGLFLLFLMQ